MTTFIRRKFVVCIKICLLWYLKRPTKQTCTYHAFLIALLFEELTLYFLSTLLNTYTRDLALRSLSRIMTTLDYTSPYLLVPLAILIITYLPKDKLFEWYLYNVLGWTVECDKSTSFEEIRKVKKLVIGCYPHTSGWDLFYGIFLVNACRGGHVMMKASLSWMRFIGIPVLAVSRGNNAGQASAIADTFGKDKETYCWLWLWISGTRQRSDFVSSGFYYIAKEAGVGLCFGSLDYKNKRMICSKIHDPQTFSKEECLVMYQEFAKEWDLKSTGYIPGNASTLAYRPSKKVD